MKSLNIKDAQKNFDLLCEEVNNTSSSLLIVNKDGKNCYLVGEDIFNSLLETISINSIEGLADSIINEGKSSYEEATDSDKLVW